NSDPAYPMLARYDGSHLVYDAGSLTPAQVAQIRGNMTVVISHGWLPRWLPNSYETGLDWATDLASLVYQRHPGLSQPPNILVWDWRHKARTIAPSTDDASEEGVELGRALQLLLGTNYGQHVHFIGHSLGAMVNRYACDY